MRLACFCNDKDAVGLKVRIFVFIYHRCEFQHKNEGRKMKVAVLMSAYNGELYISEQIESIVSTLPEAELYIHDDGSSDSTIDIINEFASANPLIHPIMMTKNFGVKKSFLNMLENVDADYYFFSDQDDIWEENKAKTFLDKAGYLDSNRPGMVYSELLLVDENNQSIGKTMGQAEWGSRDEDSKDASFLMNNRVTGASMLVNNMMKKFWVQNMKNFDFDKITMHDAFLAKAAFLSDNILFINEPLTRYRQHSNNLIGLAKGEKTLIDRATMLKAVVDESMLVAHLLEVSDIPMSSSRRSFIDLIESYYRNSLIENFVSVLFSKAWRNSVPLNKRLNLAVFQGLIKSSQVKTNMQLTK